MHRKSSQTTHVREPASEIICFAFRMALLIVMMPFMKIQHALIVILSDVLQTEG